MGRALVYQLVRRFCWLFLLVHNRLSIRGRSNIPRTRPIIMVANHCSNLDPVVMGAAYPQRLRYLAKAELFQGSRLFAWLIGILGAIPVSRQTSQSAGGALKSFLQLLEEGESVLLFPEGGRSEDGCLKPLEGGVALLALKTGALVVPAYIAGTFKAMPIGATFIRWNPVSVRFGAPLDPQLFAGARPKEARAAFLQELSRSLHAMEDAV
ncbi:MAG: 1-acyl-sn-glycerol-3-phosphate acyltransferase [Dethiosulfovibrio peptidovorans]|nr:MAG: 1-acyl-sn-glycerol-3-phosphate acyltransferase [Dethiosulfovibrio peptidovorans]